MGLLDIFVIYLVNQLDLKTYYKLVWVLPRLLVYIFIYNIFKPYIKYIICIFKLSIPKSHALANNPLTSGVDILSVISDLAQVLSQLDGFITRFNNEIITHSINVISDSGGNISIQIPDTMPEARGTLISRRISLIDHLINNHIEKAENLLHRGMSLEEDLMNKDPNYDTQLTDHVAKFRQLKNSYNHLQFELIILTLLN